MPLSQTDQSSQHKVSIEEVFATVNDIHKEGLRFSEKNMDGISTFLQTIIATSGVVAGFGFSAMDNVKNGTLFFIGQIFLGSVMIYGVMPTDHLHDLSFWTDFCEKARKVKDELREKVKKGDSSLSKEKADQVFRDFFSSNNIHEQSQRHVKDWKAKLWRLFGFFMLGFIFLLLSFTLPVWHPTDDSSYEHHHLR